LPALLALGLLILLVALPSIATAAEGTQEGARVMRSRRASREDPSRSRHTEELLMGGMKKRIALTGVLALLAVLAISVPAEASIRGKALEQTKSQMVSNCEKSNACASWTATCGKPIYKERFGEFGKGGTYRETARVPCKVIVNWKYGSGTYSCWIKYLWRFNGTKPAKIRGGTVKQHCEEF
jgi:hypothetical protein